MNRVLMSLVLLGSLAATAPPTRASGPPPSELTWGNDMLFRVLEPKIPVPAAPASWEEFFIIGTLGATQSTYGPFDHVIPIPARNRGDFSATWHVFWLEAGPNANRANVAVRSAVTPFGATAGAAANFVYAADLDGTGTLVPLTSVEKVYAAERLGLAVRVDSGITFICPVVPAS